MRLKQIKLSGFKSFVEPTAIDVAGDLVGVVGPNGCGKSNIIDAVRWVLGESRAAALRGDSMQDVIFNGSGQRKPVARAAVELIFDNSLGRAAGQWSQYAEISVRRVLQRDGESGYFINNTAVRRRDIQDIFLGTGVGPRAYAIIEQGTISRVIEAKPEDLRVFLEEAAGVSKYKERRRETENRLEDTRENLARVEDIRRELGGQIERLAEQAEVARQYQSLQEEQRGKQNLLAWLRKRDAQQQLEAANGELERTLVAIEAGTAALREIEQRLERNRLEHYEAGDQANAVQGELYAVNSEIARLESELRHIGETRQRLLQQGSQYIGQLCTWSRQSGELSESLQMWESRQGRLAEDAEQASAQCAKEQAASASLEQALREAQAAVVAARSAVADGEQRLRVDQTHRGGTLSQLEQINRRHERLHAEAQGLAPPEEQRIESLASELAGADARLLSLDENIRSGQQGLPELEASRASAVQVVERLAGSLSASRARLATLEGLQALAERNESLDGWLQRQGVSAAPRFWQLLSVPAGWERAVESVLRERLHGLALEDPEKLNALLRDPAPANVVVASAAMEPAPETAVGVGAPADRSLADLVSVSDPRFAPMVRRWLGQCAPVDEAPAAGDLDRIPAGWLWVDPSGTLYERGAVRFYAGPAGEANILVRKREIEALAEQVQGHAAQLDAARGVREQAEQRYAAEQARLRELQAHRAQEREARHRIEIDLTGLKQRRQAALTRAAEIEGELEQLAGEHAQLSGRFEGYGSAIEAHERALAQAQEHLGQVHLAQQQAERLIAAQRSVVRAAELHEQEVRFAAREAQSKLDEIRRTLHGLQAQIATTTASEHRLREELAGLEEGDLREQLQRGLEARVAIERRLSDAREALESAHAQLRQAEEGRLQAEQEIGPLRERSAELRLQQQAARLALEQFSEQLLEARADEAAIEQAYQQGRAVRPQALQNDITRLGNQMNALGPINMAALQELATSRERKEYLDAQSADLAEALSTLENAIRKIDLETRSLLQETFDTVNRNFSAMFPSLFGGGQARLEMTGEEILDAGVQVLAQPPGKRNVSVHLLSGGEKALTAISLVFSLFQLNPAPFCMLDEVDAPLDDSNTGRFCDLVKKMSGETQFVFISHNKLTMEIANQLIGVTMQEQGVSRIVAVDIDEAMKLREAA